MSDGHAVQADFIYEARQIFVGGVLVEHPAGNGFREVFGAGKITSITMTDDEVVIHTDNNIIARVRFNDSQTFSLFTDHDKIYVHHAILDTCYTLVPVAAGLRDMGGYRPET